MALHEITTKRMTQIAIMTALTCILGPFSIPIGPVPVSLSTLAVFLCVYALGMRDGCIATLLYVLLGGFGLPVFSGFTGGVAKLLGPTGGYIVGFIFMAAISGYVIDKVWPEKFYLQLIGMLLGECVLYVFGTAWFMFLMKVDAKSALATCVIPFIPFDLVKIGVAAALGMAVRTALAKAGIQAYGHGA